MVFDFESRSDQDAGLDSSLQTTLCLDPSLLTSGSQSGPRMDTQGARKGNLYPSKKMSENTQTWQLHPEKSMEIDTFSSKRSGKASRDPQVDPEGAKRELSVSKSRPAHPCVRAK